MDAYTQVGSLITYIEQAQASGLNIDDNSYGVDEELRESIKKRTTVLYTTSERKGKKGFKN
jgi:hypothetical protein